VYLYSFFNFGAGWRVGVQRHAPAALPPGKRPDIQCRRGWVDPRAGLGGCGKSRSHRDLMPGPDRPARSDSLHRLSYSGQFIHNKYIHEVIFVKNYCQDDRYISFELPIQRDKGKGKAVPLQASTGPDVSRRLRLPDFKKMGK
jgi:hypothetical protein